MERVGLPFDWPSWEQRLQEMEQRRIELSTDLAALTGGGKQVCSAKHGTSWNPASEQQAKQMPGGTLTSRTGLPSDSANFD